MSEQSPARSGNLVKPIETLTDEVLYERGARLVSDLVLPRIAHSPLTRDPYSLSGQHRYTSTAVLYSARKDISANVMLHLDLEEDLDDSSSGSELGAIMKSGGLGTATLQTEVTFVRGKFGPHGVGYGAYDYFSGLHQDPVGKLETTFGTNGSSNIQARLGGGGNDDELNIGTIDTMAVWLRDAEELKPE